MVVVCAADRPFSTRVGPENGPFVKTQVPYIPYYPLTNNQGVFEFFCIKLMMMIASCVQQNVVLSDVVVIESETKLEDVESRTQ